VVVSGNVVILWLVVDVIDRSIDSYCFYILNVEVGMSECFGVIVEISFVGLGMCRHLVFFYVFSWFLMVLFLFV